MAEGHLKAFNDLEALGSAIEVLIDVNFGPAADDFMLEVLDDPRRVGSEGSYYSCKEVVPSGDNVTTLDLQEGVSAFAFELIPKAIC